MKKLLLVALVAMVAGSVMVEAWIGDSYLIVNGNDWYNLNGGIYGLLPLTLELMEGDKIGFQVEIRDMAGVPSAVVYYGFGFASTGQNHYSLDQIGYNGGNSVWRSDDVITVTAAMNDRRLECLFEAQSDGEAVDWDNAGGAYSTTLSVTSNKEPDVVPEPATMALLGLGAAAVALRRKMRK